MNKENIIYLETERCKHLINSELKKVAKRCESMATVKQSNTLYLKTLVQTKQKAFDSIKSVVKPYVIYRINKYYYSLEN
jgi:hypothetical protein